MLKIHHVAAAKSARVANEETISSHKSNFPEVFKSETITIVTTSLHRCFQRQIETQVLPGHSIHLDLLVGHFESFKFKNAVIAKS
jgi:hypothetical protein